MRDFPNRRRQARLLVIGPGPVFVALSGPGYVPRPDFVVPFGCIICPVACDIVPAPAYLPDQVNDLKTFYLSQFFSFAPLGHVSCRFASLRAVGAELQGGSGTDPMAPGLSAAPVQPHSSCMITMGSRIPLGLPADTRSLSLAGGLCRRQTARQEKNPGDGPPCSQGRPVGIGR